MQGTQVCRTSSAPAGGGGGALRLRPRVGGADLDQCQVRQALRIRVLVKHMHVRMKVVHGQWRRHCIAGLLLPLGAGIPQRDHPHPWSGGKQPFCLGDGWGLCTARARHWIASTSWNADRKMKMGVKRGGPTWEERHGTQ